MCSPIVGIREANSDLGSLRTLQHLYIHIDTSNTPMQRMMKPADPMIMYFTNDIVEVADPVGTSVVLVVGDAVRYCVACSL